MVSEIRKEQLREAQKRRREKLASGDRFQVNIFLTQQSKELVDEWCKQYLIDRHDLLNGLITAYSKSPNSIPFQPISKI